MPESVSALERPVDSHSWHEGWGPAKHFYFGPHTLMVWLYTQSDLLYWCFFSVKYFKWHMVYLQFSLLVCSTEVYCSDMKVIAVKESDFWLLLKN